MTAGDVVAFCLVTGAATAGVIRWLRVGQREHYLPGAVTRFAARWWLGTTLNRVAFVAGGAAALAALAFPPVGLVTGALVVVAPLGLSLRGRTSRLRWTRRLATAAAVTAFVEAVVIAAGALAGSWTGGVVAAGLFAVASPLALDLALALTAPVERIAGARYVTSAVAKLGRIRPTIVAVTGSYGKTTTKGYIAHLVGAYKSTLPSPHSYNNRAGLARTVNDHLGAGTEVLVAEMGAYGPGEIAALCESAAPGDSRHHRHRPGAPREVQDAREDAFRQGGDRRTSPRGGSERGRRPPQLSRPLAARRGEAGHRCFRH